MWSSCPPIPPSWLHPPEMLISFPLNIYLEEGFLDHIVILFLLFWGPFIYFSQWLYQFAFLLTMYWGSFSLHCHQNLLSPVFLRIVTQYICGHFLFLFWFIDDQWCWASSQVTFCHLYIFFGKCLFRSSVIFSWIICCFAIK